MKNTQIQKIFGLALSVVGAVSLVLLLFFYASVLFSDQYPSLKEFTALFKTFFTVPTGLLMLYASFIILSVPFLSVTALGLQLFLRKKIITKVHVYFCGALWVVAVVYTSLTLMQQVQEITTRLNPFSQNPVQMDVQDSIPLAVQYAFKTTLKNEVNAKLGMPKEGYEPYMFMKVFPGLTETDFEGVEASIGNYTVIDGVLTHKLDESKLIHSAAKAITDRGLDTLLTNISIRLKIDLTKDGTLTEVISAIARSPQKQ